MQTRQIPVHTPIAPIFHPSHRYVRPIQRASVRASPIPSPVDPEMVAQSGLSYAALNAFAILHSPDGTITNTGAYQFYETYFPGLTSAKDTWKQSVRHNFCTTKYFVKIQDGVYRLTTDPIQIAKFKKSVEKRCTEENLELTKRDMTNTDALQSILDRFMKWANRAPVVMLTPPSDVEGDRRLAPRKAAKRKADAMDANEVQILRNMNIPVREATPNPQMMPQSPHTPQTPPAPYGYGQQAYQQPKPQVVYQALPNQHPAQQRSPYPVQYYGYPQGYQYATPQPAPSQMGAAMPVSPQMYQHPQYQNYYQPPAQVPAQMPRRQPHPQAHYQQHPQMQPAPKMMRMVSGAQMQNPQQGVVYRKMPNGEIRPVQVVSNARQVMQSGMFYQVPGQRPVQAPTPQAQPGPVRQAPIQNTPRPTSAKTDTSPILPQKQPNSPLLMETPQPQVRPTPPKTPQVPVSAPVQPKAPVVEAPQVVPKSEVIQLAPTPVQQAPPAPKPQQVSCPEPVQVQTPEPEPVEELTPENENDVFKIYDNLVPYDPIEPWTFTKTADYLDPEEYKGGMHPILGIPSWRVEDLEGKDDDFWNQPQTLITGYCGL
ncbi:hypothetical protein QR680_017038 [Steinernema hermaphroditum]|uniref:Fork-head domain-containing protein n=1 Tax=Steinernema hermaphroditum TaxID=289476 RepID=A0AA39LNI6_9BILA|nr:hypothetical protein QR680_017038 [Steinernema hermaphroditum]